MLKARQSDGEGEEFDQISRELSFNSLSRILDKVGKWRSNRVEQKSMVQATLRRGFRGAD